LWCWFAAFASALVLSDPEGGNGKNWERIAWLAGAALAVGTGSIGFVMPISSCVWRLACWVIGALAWLFKPHLYLATSLLRLTMLYLVPLALLDTMALRFCGESDSLLMQQACAFVGSVQLAARAQDAAHVPNPWWLDLVLCAWLLVVVVLLEHCWEQAIKTSWMLMITSMYEAAWVRAASNKLIGFVSLFKRRVYA
jgi:hypothetical protein